MIWPVGIITDRFGTMAPYRKKPHRGIDIAATEGTPLVAIADGVIQFNAEHGGMGYTLRVYHGWQNSHEIHAIYGHMREVGPVMSGKVRGGQLIGFVGNTGNSLGAHLHLEVWHNWVPVDPEKHLGEIGDIHKN